MYKKHSYLIIPFLVFLFLYDMVVNGMVPLASDMLAHQPIKEWIKSTEEFPHWFPNLFSGMPSYGGYIYTPGNPLSKVINFILFNSGVKQWFYLSLGGLGLYCFLRFKNISYFSSIFGGIAYSLTPHVFGLINAGHNTKIMAFSFVPWIFFSVSYLFQEKSIKSVLFLSIISAFQLWVNHPQVVYYTWMFIFGYWAYSFIDKSIKDKKIASFKVLFYLLISISMTTLMVSDPYVDIFAFQNHSNRGAPSVLDETNETSSGTKWDYATQWSFHPMEIISFALPYHFGLQNFSVKNRTNPSEFMKQASYWGYMPFTQSTHYMGLLILLLPILSLVSRIRERNFSSYENFLWIISLIFLVVGFGKHFPMLYQLLFDYAPFFSKFRIPSMIYLILVFTFSFLTATSIDYIIKLNKDDLIKSSQIVVGTFIGIIILFFIFGESIFSFSSPGDARFPNYIQFVQAIRVDYFNKGLILALAVSLSFFGLIWSYVHRKISKNLFLYSMLAILVIDLWILNNEFLSLTKKKNFESQFIKSTVIDHILNDDSNFRIFPADDLGSNIYGYWGIQSIGGYRAVKLRNYQDLMDVGGFKRPTILNMLNVKYLLTKKAVKNPAFTKITGLEGIYQNLDYLPRAWFVNKIDNVKDQKASLNRLMDISFRPNEKAILVGYDGPILDENGDGYIESIDLKTNTVKINCFSKGGSLLVLSEIYYKPGWKCKINGKNTKIYQANHVLRSIYVPDGKHEVVFYYDSSDWQTARLTSRASFFLATFFCLFLFFNERKSILNLKKS